MKKPIPRRLWAASACVALVLAFCSMRVPSNAQGQPPGNASFALFSSTASQGSSPYLGVAGYSNCSVTAFDSNTSGTITVYGSTTGFTPSDIWSPNTNFGTSGSIPLTATPTSYSANITNYPAGFYVGWSGESGTITLQATCTVGTSSTTNGGMTTALVSPIPLPVTPTGVPTWPVDSNGRPIVTTPPPYVPSPQASPALTPSAAPPNAPQVNSIMHCQYSGALASPSPPPATAGQIVVPRCSSDYILGTLRVFAGSSGVRYVDTVPDAQATSSAVSGSGTITVKIIPGVANHATYLWFGAYVSTGTNTATDTYSLIYGQTTTTPCDTNAHVIVPASTGSSASGNGAEIFLYSSTAATATDQFPGFYPAPVARPIPAASPANDVCGQVVVITASNGYFQAAYAIP